MTTQTWERRTEWPLAFAAVLFLGAYAWPIVDPDLDRYGDRYPVTAGGRLVDVGLMIAGIAVLGTVTATVASWLVDTVSAETSEEVDDLRIQVAALVALLKGTRPDIAEALPSTGPSAGPMAGLGPAPADQT